MKLTDISVVGQRTPIHFAISDLKCRQYLMTYEALCLSINDVSAS